jgi:hypothetical protein
MTCSDHRRSATHGSDDSRLPGPRRPAVRELGHGHRATAGSDGIQEADAEPAFDNCPDVALTAALGTDEDEQHRPWPGQQVGGVRHAQDRPRCWLDVHDRLGGPGAVVLPKHTRVAAVVVTEWGLFRPAPHTSTTSTPLHYRKGIAQGRDRPHVPAEIPETSRERQAFQAFGR